MKLLSKLWLALLLAPMLFSCTYDSKVPLPQPYEALPSALEGDWEAYDEKNEEYMQLRIYPSEGQAHNQAYLVMENEVNGVKSLDTLRFSINRVQVENHKGILIQLKLKNDEGGGYYYVVGEVDLNTDTFTFKWLEEKAFKKGSEEVEYYNSPEEFQKALAQKIKKGNPFAPVQEAATFKRQ